MENTDTVRDVLCTPTAGNCISTSQVTVGNNINGSVGDRRSEGEDSQTGYLNPVVISLISVSGVILLIVSTILMIVFLLWRRRSMDVKGRKSHEERTGSNSSPTSPAHPHQERADLNPPYYHVLTEEHPRSLSQQVGIHADSIACDVSLNMLFLLPDCNTCVHTVLEQLKEKYNHFKYPHTL